jgi:hypothetical protein
MTQLLASDVLIEDIQTPFCTVQYRSAFVGYSAVTVDTARGCRHVLVIVTLWTKIDQLFTELNLDSRKNKNVALAIHTRFSRC